MGYFLGVVGLPATEVNLLRSIIKLSPQFNSIWSITPIGDLEECRGILCAADTYSWLLSHNPGNAIIVPVLRKGEHSQAQVSLSRPIHMDAFSNLLTDLQFRRSAPLSGAIPLHRRARLFEFPSEKSVSESKTWFKMALMLMRDFTSINELHEKTGCGKSDCHSFFRAMQKAGLLEWEVPFVATAKATAAAIHPS